MLLWICIGLFSREFYKETSVKSPRLQLGSMVDMVGVITNHMDECPLDTMERQNFLQYNG